MARRGFTLIQLLVVIAIIVVLIACFAPWRTEMAFTVVVGWIAYIGKVIPRLNPDPWVVCTAILCLVGVILGTHTFLKWLYSATSAEPRYWSRKWTLQFVGLVALMFVAGIAFTAVVHQTTWLIRSPEPLAQSSIQRAAAQTQSANNLKQLGLAAFSYEDNTKPPEFPRSQFAPNGQAMHSWQTLLLPYLEDGPPLYKQIDLSKPWTDPANAPAMGTRPRAFLNPALPDENVNGYGVSHYAGNVHVVLSDTPRAFRSFSLSAGTSNTILAGEVSSNYRAWGDPLNARNPRLGPSGNPNGFGGPKGKLAQFVMLDGSVRTFDPQELAELLAKSPE
jgi:hypothetical protein